MKLQGLNSLFYIVCTILHRPLGVLQMEIPSESLEEISSFIIGLKMVVTTMRLAWGWFDVKIVGLKMVDIRFGLKMVVTRMRLAGGWFDKDSWPKDGCHKNVVGMKMVWRKDSWPKDGCYKNVVGMWMVCCKIGFAYRGLATTNTRRILARIASE